MMDQDIQLETAGAHLAAARRARLNDHRHELAHEHYLRALEVAEATGDMLHAAKAMLGLSGNMMWHCPADWETSELLSSDLVSRAMSLFEQAGDEAGVAACLLEMGRLDDSLAISERIGDLKGMVFAHLGFAGVSVLGKEPDRAKQHLTQAEKLARQLDDPHVLAIALHYAGTGYEGDGIATNRAQMLEATDLFRQLGHRPKLAECLELCACWYSDDDPAMKATLLSEAKAINAELGRDCLLPE